ncbi:MAG: hypothetical protein INH34_06100 [Phycisphaerales bacterium]|nr:hypothetical protein [Phycisphaerales bacterium]
MSEPTTEIRTVTPEMAVEWLRRNTNNRRVVWGHVAALRKAMKAGEWTMTHQGIAFDEDGVILDGQHRLLALTGMPDGFSIKMMVTFGLPRGQVWHGIDVSVRVRRNADVLPMHPVAVSVGSFLASLAVGTRSVSAPVAEPFVRWIEPEVLRLLRDYGGFGKTFSSSPVRAAAVFTMKRLPECLEIVVDAYGALVEQDFDRMTTVAKAFSRGVALGSIRAGGTCDRPDMFLRAMKVFDPAHADTQKLIIRDAVADLVRVRADLRARVLGQEA